MIAYTQILNEVRETALCCGRNPSEITLIAVSKNCSVPLIQEVYHAGCSDFGESRLQEAKLKIPLLPENCKWHFIGTLQSNKIMHVRSFFQLIHSVDTPRLAQCISLACERSKTPVSILLQVNTSGEITKHGLSPEEWEKHLELINQLPFLQIEGLMTMAPFTEDKESIRRCFKKLYQLREKWQKNMRDPKIFHHLSMGMSHDYNIAIEEGATLLRIGSAIFNP